MARGWGRSLDLVTLMVIIRHRLNVEEVDSFDIRFDKHRGFTAWFGRIEPDEEEMKFFETLDSALLALIVGRESVAGTDDD